MLQIALQGETFLFNIIMTKEGTFGLHVATQLMKIPKLERDDLMAKIKNIFNAKKIELSQRQASLVLNEPNDEVNAQSNNENLEINNADIGEISAANNTNAVELQDKQKRKKNKKGKLMSKYKKIKINLIS